jgi:hypothetical protein
MVEEVSEIPRMVKKTMELDQGYIGVRDERTLHERSS